VDNGIEAQVATDLAPIRTNRVGATTDETSVELVLAAARRRMDAPVCAFVTSGPDGPTALGAMPFPPADDLSVHVRTFPASTHQVADTGRAVLAYNTGLSACVTAYCNAEVLDDPDERLRWWLPFFSTYWPDGPDKGYSVIRCRPYALEVWSPEDGIGPARHGLRPGCVVLDQGRWILDVR